MRRDIFPVARHVANEIQQAEVQHDRDMAQSARLIATILDARCDAGVPASTGQTAIAKVFEALSLKQAARDSLIAAHADLAGLNLRELSVGDVFETPDWPKGQLELVSNEEQAA